jgi:hypothetical protein
MAAITMHITGSSVIALSSTRAPGAFSAGASVSSRKREQRQFQADRLTAKILEPRAVSSTERKQADDKQHGSDRRVIQRSRRA